MVARTYSSTERIGIAAVALAVESKLRWIWREQPTSDFGIDGQIEIVDKNRQPTGQLIAVQVKSGPSYFEKGDSSKFYINDDHWQYWRSHSLPVIIVLHNSESGLTIWEWVDPDTVSKAGKNWVVAITHRNILGDSQYQLSQLAPVSSANARRRRFALDIGLIRLFRGHELFLTFEVWVNKSLAMRGFEIRMDDPEKAEPDYEFEWWIASSDIQRILWIYFPWLKVEECLSVENYSGEVEETIYSTRLSSAADAFLDLEDYFEGAVEPDDLPSLYPGYEDPDAYEHGPFDNDE